MSLTYKIQQKRLREARKLVKSSQLAIHIGSVAVAIEALEELLVERGILKPDELMERVKEVSKRHYARDENIPPSED